MPPANASSTRTWTGLDYHDPEAGLAYNLHRHYDPDTARYTSQDSLGLAPNPNPATYVHNPHTWADPLGLAPCNLPSRSAAFRDAKEQLGIPRSQHPDEVRRVNLDGEHGTIRQPNGAPVQAREYDFTHPQTRERFTIQEHSRGHTYDGGAGNQGPHFNVRPHGQRSGSVEGVNDHIYFNP